MMARSQGRSLLTIILVLLFVTDVGLLLLLHHSKYYASSSWLRYAHLILDSATYWTGVLTIVWGLVIGAMALHALIRGQQPNKISFVDVLLLPAGLIEKILSQPCLSFAAIVAELVVAIIVGVALHPPAVFFPASSTIVAAPDGKSIFLIGFGDNRGLLLQVSPISLRTKGYWEVGEARQVAFAPKIGHPNEIGRILVTVLPNELKVIDPKDEDQLSVVSVALGEVQEPQSIAVTRDGRKAYIGNVGPFPPGSISIVELGEKPELKGTIRGVNCPKGMAIAGRWLYVASQCGGGHDPLFIIDTESDKIVSQVPDLAVGGAVGVLPGGKKVYVGRTNQRMESLSGRVGSPLSVVDAESRKVLSTQVLDTSVEAIAITPDGRYTLVGNGNKITVLDTKTDAIVKTVCLDAGPSGIAALQRTENNQMIFDRVYAALPGARKPRLFFTDLSGILSGGAKESC